MSERVWTKAQFDEMSWHDNHVHALRVVEGPCGAGRLELDLDYIAEWVKGSDGACRFRIVPAILGFTEVTRLKIALDYAEPAASLGPFSIHEIERRREQRARCEVEVWTIRINWPRGEITFEARGFEQRAWGVERLFDQQALPAAERRDSSA